MDKKLIEQFGQDILSYRIRTARQKKRAVYEDFDKHLLRLDRESEALWKWKYGLGCEPLIPPVQRGWVRTFVLKEDVARSPDQQLYANILAKINTRHYDSRKDFKVKKRRMGRRTYVTRTQKLRDLSFQEWRKLDETEKSFFFLVAEVHSNRVYYRYVFREPWRFVLKVKPNLVDKVPIQDIGMEQRWQRLRNYTDLNGYVYRQRWLTRGHFNWLNFDEPYYDPNPIKNKTLRQILAEAREENL